MLGSWLMKWQSKGRIGFFLGLNSLCNWFFPLYDAFIQLLSNLCWLFTVCIPLSFLMESSSTKKKKRNCVLGHLLCAVAGVKGYVRNNHKILIKYGVLQNF